MPIIHIGYDADGSLLDVADVDAFYAAANPGDEGRFHYATPERGLLHIGALNGGDATTKWLHLTGAVPGVTLWSSSASSLYRLEGDLSGQTEPVIIRGLRFLLNGNSLFNLRYSDSSSQGAGVHISQCSFSGYTGVSITGAQPLSCRVDSCLFHFCRYGVYGNVPIRIYGCTFAECYQGPDCAAQAGEMSNCLVVSCESAEPYRRCTNITGSHNACDTVLPPGTDPIQTTRAAMKLWADQPMGRMDFRLSPDPTSVLRHAGVVIAGHVTDLDGQARPDPPSVGCSEPVELGTIEAGGTGARLLVLPQRRWRAATGNNASKLETSSYAQFRVLTISLIIT